MAKDDKAAEAPEKGVEIVPLFMFTPRGFEASMKGGQMQVRQMGEYVRGPLDERYLLTFPGVPLEVRTKAYADELVAAGLACYPKDMTFARVPDAYKEENDNKTRWGGN